MGPYAFNGNQWVSFDDQKMLQQKAQYIKKNNLGGGMVWALDLDDFKGKCGQGKYPLLKIIHDELQNGETYVSQPDNENVIGLIPPVEEAPPFVEEKPEVPAEKPETPEEKPEAPEENNAMEAGGMTENIETGVEAETDEDDEDFEDSNEIDEYENDYKVVW